MASNGIKICARPDPKFLPTNFQKNILNIYIAWVVKPVSSQSLLHCFPSKHIVSNLTSQDLSNHVLSPQALPSRRKDHVTQAHHLFQDFLEHQGYLGYQEKHRSPA